jgi:hypothetical protein
MKNRFRVYEAVKIFINHATYQEQVIPKDIHALLDGIRGAEFLLAATPNDHVRRQPVESANEARPSGSARRRFLRS